MDNKKDLQNEKIKKDALEPIVLGTVKKGRTGKPILAIFIILIIAGLIYFLPVVGDYFKDKSIIDLIKNGELIDYIMNKNNDTSNKDDVIIDEYTLVGNGSVISNGVLIISNIQLKENVLSYNIKSSKATYDATKDNLYLQIFVDKNTLVYTKAIDEVFIINGKDVKENVTFYKNSDKYYAKLVNINDNDIKDITLSSDESGLASIICTKDNDTYEYIFQNKELIEMERTYQYKYNEQAISDYQKALMAYRDLANERVKYKIVTDVTEDSVGFTYKESIDLSKADVTSLGNNYYAYRYLAKVILFKQEAKGFDCE